jgi:hypothetical protein
MLRKDAMFTYVLDSHEPKPEPDHITWARWFETADRVVRQDHSVGGKWFVSTVFLGIDHSFLEEQPILFETMVFAEGGSAEEDACERYATWEEAERGHEELVERYGGRQKEQT